MSIHPPRTEVWGESATESSLSFHEGFDFVRGTDDGFREAFAAVFCDQKIVFNADTNLPFVDVETRLICNDRTRF